MNTLNILVTGSNGQLGSEIRLPSHQTSHYFTFIDIQELDLTSAQLIESYLNQNKFDIIVNCAAYTAVDLAEQNSELAYKINFEAVKFIADFCLRKHIRLIHISTDYVFDGSGNSPISEASLTNPLSVYGKSKLECDNYIQTFLKDYYILRTAWVYSTFGKNFVKTIAGLAKERDSLNVIYDQIGSPTYARDLALTILQIIENIASRENDFPGLYHYSNEGVTSWYDFATFIVDFYKFPCKVIPIKTEQYKTLAVRPKFSVLSKEKTKTILKIEIPHWHQSLVECLEKLQLSEPSI